MKVKPLSHVRPSAIPWTAAFQAPPSMGFSRDCYCNLNLSLQNIQPFIVSYTQLSHFTDWQSEAQKQLSTFAKLDVWAPLCVYRLISSHFSCSPTCPALPTLYDAPVWHAQPNSLAKANPIPGSNATSSRNPPAPPGGLSLSRLCSPLELNFYPFLFLWPKNVWACLSQFLGSDSLRVISYSCLISP